MASNAALCLCFMDELPPSAPRAAGLPALIERVLEVIGPDRRTQFCLGAESLAAGAGLLEHLSKGSRELDICLALSGSEDICDPSVLGQRISGCADAFRQARLGWWGMALPGAFDLHLEDGPELIRQMMEAGCRWIAFSSNALSGRSALPAPVLAADDLVHIPMVDPFRGIALESEAGASRKELARQALDGLLVEASRGGRILVLAFALDGLIEMDPGLELLRGVIARAEALGLPLVTLNEIADITLARHQAGAQARDRVSVQQNIQFRTYWDTVIGPSQQAYKVYDYRGGWRLKPGFYRHGQQGWEILSEADPAQGYQINQHGFRGAMFPHRKPQGETRIMIVGDSCVFGVAGDTKPWPAQVQIRLDELAGPGRLRVINAGIEGQSSVHCWMRLERLLTFEPDWLVVSVGANDLFIENPAEYVDTTGLEYAASWELTGEYPHERDITRLVAGVRRPMTLEEFFPYDYAYHLREIVRRCRQKGVRPVLLTQTCLLPADISLASGAHLAKMHNPPFVLSGDMGAMRRLYDVYNRALWQTAKEEGAEVVDGEGFFAGHYEDRRAALFSDTCHPTVEGNIYLGRYVAEKLWEILQS